MEIPDQRRRNYTPPGTISTRQSVFLSRDGLSHDENLALNVILKFIRGIKRATYLKLIYDILPGIFESGASSCILKTSLNFIDETKHPNREEFIHPILEYILLGLSFNFEVRPIQSVPKSIQNEFRKLKSQYGTVADFVLIYKQPALLGKGYKNRALSYSLNEEKSNSNFLKLRRIHRALMKHLWKYIENKNNLAKKYVLVRLNEQAFHNGLFYYVFAILPKTEGTLLLASKRKNGKFRRTHRKKYKPKHARK